MPENDCNTGEWKTQLLIFDDTGVILHDSATAVTSEITLPAGVYRATFTVDTEQLLLLTTTHSMLIRDGRQKLNWCTVTGFPDEWEPGNLGEYGNFPDGEYCITTRGWYRRKAVRDE